MNIHKNDSTNEAAQQPYITRLVEVILGKINTESKPAFQQLANIICDEIHAKNIPPGSKLPPYRTLSWQIGLSPGTVQRAYRELERQCLIAPRIGDGSYVLHQPRGNQPFRNAPDFPFVDLSRNQFLHSTGLEEWKKHLDISATDDDHLFSLLNYTDERGLPAHRQAGAAWVRHHGCNDISAERVFCTNGSQHGLHLILTAVMQRHDALAVDEYTYPGILSLARRMNIRLVSIKGDAFGLCPADLHDQIKKNRISAVFIMPTLHNPMNCHMPDSRRDEIAAICKTAQIFIIEDETQGVLSGHSARPFLNRLPEQTILATSVSKALSSGLRAGYLIVPDRMIEAFKKAVRENCWMATPMSHEVASRCIKSGFAEKSIVTIQKEITRRKTFINTILDSIPYISADYSSHYWIKLAKGMTDADALQTLLESNVKVSPSSHFSSRHFQESSFIRVSVTAYADDATLMRAFESIRDINQARHTMQRLYYDKSE